MRNAHHHTVTHVLHLVILCTAPTVLLERRRPIEVRTEEHHRFRRQRATRLAVPCTSVTNSKSVSQSVARGVSRVVPFYSRVLPPHLRAGCTNRRRRGAPRAAARSPAQGAKNGRHGLSRLRATPSPREIKQGSALTVAPSSRSASVAAARAALIRPAAGSASSSVPASGGGGGGRRRRR